MPSPSTISTLETKHQEPLATNEESLTSEATEVWSESYDTRPIYGSPSASSGSTNTDLNVFDTAYRQLLLNETAASTNVKDVNKCEYTFNSHTLTVDSDPCDNISTGTVDIASLQPNSDEFRENNSNRELEIISKTSKEEENRSDAADNVFDIETPLEVSSLHLTNNSRWGENRRRQSLMMKYALKNSLETSSSHQILNGNVNDVVNPSGCGSDGSLEPSADVYAWASSCANLNPVGPRFKLIRDGDVQICYLDHTRTVISKILSFKFLRHFESHHLFLGDCKIYPRNVSYLNILFCRKYHYYSSINKCVSSI